MPPGRYFVGDLFLVLDKDKLLRYGVLGGYASSPEEEDGFEYCSFLIRHTECVLHDQHGRVYPIPSGTIGCVEEGKLGPLTEEMMDYGHFIEFPREFNIVQNEHGELFFDQQLIKFTKL
jgi:hypothetical protein